MANYVLVEPSGLIVNRIVIEEIDGFEPGEDLKLVLEPDGESWEIGARVVGGKYLPLQRPPVLAEPKTHVLPQDIIAQFTVEDAARIQAAIASDVRLWLLWATFQTQHDPMSITNQRFLDGWAALRSVLGADRMAAIAAALDIALP